MTSLNNYFSEGELRLLPERFDGAWVKTVLVKGEIKKFCVTKPAENLQELLNRLIDDNFDDDIGEGYIWENFRQVYHYLNGVDEEISGGTEEEQILDKCFFGGLARKIQRAWFNYNTTEMACPCPE